MILFEGVKIWFWKEALEVGDRVFQNQSQHYEPSSKFISHSIACPPKIKQKYGGETREIRVVRDVMTLGEISQTA